MKKTFLFVLIFLIACSGPQETFNPEVTVTSTSRPPLPSFTPLPDTKLNPTEITPNQTEVAARDAMQTEIAQFPRICKDSYYSPGYSPNGLWRVELCSSEFDEGLIMTLSSSKTKVLWKMIYRDYIPSNDIVPDGGMLVAHWSKDGRYAYFYSHGSGSGGECYTASRSSKGGFGVFRLDLETGEITTILPLGKAFKWYGFSFSPTDRRLVYGVSATDFMILDMKTAEVTNIYPAKEFEEGGGFLWSPDGLEFIYSTVAYTPDHVDRESYTLRLVDSQTGAERILLESKTNCYLATEWKDNNVLMVEYDDENYNRALMEYDLNLNTIIDASASPAP